MSRLSAQLLACAMVLSLSAPASVAQVAKPSVAARHKVVFQVSESDPKKWELTLNNVRNVQKDLGKDNVDVEIVAYGPGIDMLRLESTSGGRVEEALKQGVQVVVCENTLRALKLTRADMLDHVGYVEAGVSELIKRQEQGYAYIRP